MPTMESETAMSPLEYQEQEQEKIELIDDDKKLKEKQKMYQKLRDTECSKSSMSEKHSDENEERSKEVLKESSDPSTQPEEECLIRSRKRRSDSPRTDCTPSKMVPAEEAFQYDLDWELHKFTADIEQRKQEQQEEDEEQTQRPEGWIYDLISQYVSTNMSTTSTSFFANYCAAEKSKSFAQLNEEELFGEDSDNENKPKPTVKPKKSEEVSEELFGEDSDSENKPKPTEKSEEVSEELFGEDSDNENKPKPTEKSEEVSEELLGEDSDSENKPKPTEKSEEVSEELFGEDSDSENKPKPMVKSKKSEELLHSESKANQLQQQQQRKGQQQLQLKYETLHEKLAQKHEDMLKNFQQMLIKLLREVSVEITKELCGKQPKQETFNPNKLDETWCLPYGSDSKVIVNSSKEGIMSIRVEPLMPMKLRTSRTRRSERREDDCKPRTEQWCWDNAIEQQPIEQQPIEQQSIEQQPIEQQSIEQQSIDPESFAEQQLYKEPTEHYPQYPSTNANPLRFQHDYCRQLASDYVNDSEDQSNDDGDNNVEANRNNNNTNAVEVQNPFDVYNDHIESDWNNLHSVDNTVAVDMELDSDCGSNWSGSKTLCSDKTDSTLQLEISDREYQRLLQRSRIECFEHQHKLDMEARSSQMYEQLIHNTEDHWQTQPTKAKEDGECEEEY
ncbi:probable WRKY transcription factor protein 1 [Drosophila albomicans]|uniref:Probable WRKY transcription factor protein 1 n=1 Tax=Drosophila albomicans TaxID=7291 RepID=A0A9C6T3N2_DROAB|nr:probable WRKY transcription factor protein 1 [Drosophila albomicans]